MQRAQNERNNFNHRISRHNLSFTCEFLPDGFDQYGYQIDSAYLKGYANGMQRLSLKRPWHHLPRAILALGIAFLLFAIPTYAAIQNLVARDAMIRSSLWLLLVGFFIVVAFACETSPVRMVIAVLGLLARNQFVEIMKCADSSDKTDLEDTDVAFGYRLLFFDLYYLKVSLDKVISVDWSAGQFADSTDEQAFGWLLWVRYKDKWDGKGWPSDYSLYEVGDGGSRQQVEALGRRLVAFLENAGADFTEVHTDRLTGFKKVEREIEGEQIV